MSLRAIAATLAERAPLPDVTIRLGVAAMVKSTARRLAKSGVDTRDFADRLSRLPVATHTDAANAQHYEIPAEFFALVLGPQRKYSCCLFPYASTDLGEAEQLALAQTAANAGLRDGQTILELGCGWGSLSLWMAASFPRSDILSISNSASQRAHILSQAAARGLTNIEVVTADMNVFDTRKRFDRIVSVEMFEHMANWAALLARIRNWLEPEGRLFIHVFAHRTTPYLFDHEDRGDWIAQHFFTGGLMPSRSLIREFASIFTIEREWYWPGHHYARTARCWLSNFDRNRVAIEPILASTYGSNATLWARRWRLFFLATEGLFSHDTGAEWGICHYLMRPASD